MKNLKKELKDTLLKRAFDEDEIVSILENFIDACEDKSEILLIKSLNERLNSYTYNKAVRKLLESLNDDVSQYQLLYELKHLYNVLSHKNYGEMYRQPINVLLQTINLDSDQDRMVKILNELSIYDYVPEIKLFVYNLTKNPQQKANLLSGGKTENVYALCEEVLTDKGLDANLCFIKDSWFLFTENGVEKTLLETYVKDNEKLRTLRNLQTAFQVCTIDNEKLNFKVSENLVLGFSQDKKGVIYVNDDEMNKETTLESVFSSPIIPLVNRNFYPLLVEFSNNLGKIVYMDIVKKVSNIMNPYLEMYVFNYGENVYAYRCDERQGKQFYKYDDAITLVNEVKNNMQCDLTYFYEDKLEVEMVTKRKLEDKIRELTIHLEDLNTNIDKLETNIKYLTNSDVLQEALLMLNEKKEEVVSDLRAAKELMQSYIRPV